MASTLLAIARLGLPSSNRSGLIISLIYAARTESGLAPPFIGRFFIPCLIGFMPSIIRSSRIKPRPPPTTRPALEIGARVELISGALAGLSGEVVRVEKQDLCLIAVPNSSTGLLIRVPRQRFRRVNNRAES